MGHTRDEVMDIVKEAIVCTIQNNGNYLSNKIYRHIVRSVVGSPIAFDLITESFDEIGDVWLAMYTELWDTEI